MDIDLPALTHTGLVALRALLTDELTERAQEHASNPNSGCAYLCRKLARQLQTLDMELRMRMTEEANACRNNKGD